MHLSNQKIIYALWHPDSGLVMDFVLETPQDIETRISNLIRNSPMEYQGRSIEFMREDIKPRIIYHQNNIPQEMNIVGCFELLRGWYSTMNSPNFPLNPEDIFGADVWKSYLVTNRISWPPNWGK